MKSIRLSLLVYFLGLLTAALGVSSFLVYRTAERTLAEKEEAAASLVEARHEHRCREVRQRLDDTLLTQAQGLARRAKVQVDWNRFGLRNLHVLGAVLALAGPNGQVTAPLWIAHGTRGSLAFELHRHNLAEIGLPETDLVLPAEGEVGEYFQIESNYRGAPLRSPSLGELSFPEEPTFGANEVLHWEWDDVDLDEGRVVRRVRLKAASAQRVNIFSQPTRGTPPRPGPGGPPDRTPPRPGPGGGPAAGPGRPSRPTRWAEPSLAIVVQCAADVNRRDDALASLSEERDAELAGLRSETNKALRRQFNWLLVIAAVTFLASAVGSVWLVRLGLVPVNRLSEAVSRISPRDFRLPLAEADLPSELQPIASRLSVTLDLLKRAFAREKQSTADISHELRTPLAALLTTIDLALRKPRTAEKYQQMLGDCRSSALQMNQIVERLLTLARLDAGVDLLRPQSLDVGELAEQCAAVVRPLAEAQGLELAVHNECVPPAEGGESAARLAADPDKLREVLNNLLHNAVQYNRPEGRIDVRVARVNGHVELAVADTGVGIPPDARERIFERFYRADPSRTGDGMNAGLGLAIVKEYIDLMGGTIAVESAEGRGSTFRVCLPVR